MKWHKKQWILSYEKCEWKINHKTRHKKNKMICQNIKKSSFLWLSFFTFTLFFSASKISGKIFNSGTHWAQKNSLVLDVKKCVLSVTMKSKKSLWNAKIFALALFSLRVRPTKKKKRFSFKIQIHRRNIECSVRVVVPSNPVANFVSFCYFYRIEEKNVLFVNFIHHRLASIMTCTLIHVGVYLFFYFFLNVSFPTKNE